MQESVMTKKRKTSNTRQTRKVAKKFEQLKFSVRPRQELRLSISPGQSPTYVQRR